MSELWEVAVGMTTQILQLEIGPLVLDGEHYDTRIVAGRYGNAVFTASGYVVADPCYLLSSPDNSDLCRVFHETYPWKGYNYQRHKDAWQPFTWRNRKCFARDTGGDGESYFGLTVDSGWVVAMPLVFCTPEVQQIFAKCDPA